jgi:hypothetical protein
VPAYRTTTVRGVDRKVRVICVIYPGDIGIPGVPA